MNRSGGESGSGGSGDISPSYVPKGDFDRVSNEFQSYKQQQEQRWQQFESRLPKQEAKAEAQTGTRNPYDNMSDYKFHNANGTPNEKELQRFHRDVFRYENDTYSKEKAEKERPEIEQRQQQEYTQRVVGEHNRRMTEYEKENPGSIAKFEQSPFQTYTGLHPLILESDKSPELISYMIDHPETQHELNSIAMQAGDNWKAAATRYLGRIESKIENQSQVIKQRENAYRAEPTVGAFPRSSVPKKQKLSPKELKELWR